MKIKKILWPYDGSEHSEYALSHAEFFSRSFGADIHGIHVYSISLPVNPYYAPYLYDVAEKTEEKYQSEFKNIGDKLKKNWITFKSTVIRGDAPSEIVRYADENDIDLITMGITPRGFVGSLLVESASVEVLRKTRKPVLITRSRGKDKKINLKKILVPVDVGDKMPEGLETALFLAQKEECHVTVVYVMNIAFQVYEVPEKIISEIIEEATQDIKNYVDDIVSQPESPVSQNKNFSILTKVIFGMNPASRLVDYANRNKFDLIVINSHGKEFFKRLLLGSTAEQIARESSCPVLVVKPRAEEKDENQ